MVGISVRDRVSVGLVLELLFTSRATFYTSFNIHIHTSALYLWLAGVTDALIKYPV